MSIKSINTLIKVKGEAEGRGCVIYSKELLGNHSLL